MSEEKKKKSDGSGNIFKKLAGKFREIAGEFKKIIWPDKKTLAKHTVNVILIAGAIGLVIVAMDLVFSQGYASFVNIFSRG